MAGFEVVVRPVIFPDIRPRAQPSLPPQDDPTKGFAVIKGNPASSVGLSDSWSVSQSKSRPVEVERRVDEVRVYQKEDDGTINKKNFVDVEVVNRLKMNDPGHVDTSGPGFGTPGTGSSLTYEQRVEFYKKLEEAENIEIRNRDIVKKNPDYKAGS